MNTLTRYAYRLWIPISFPAGLAPGAGKDSGNLLGLSRDGRNRPVLRGTAIAGVIRHAWAQKHGYNASPMGHDDELARWFGYALGDDASEGGEHRNLTSPLHVSDVVLCTGDSEHRQHNAIDRHVGSVRSGGLFSLEALPPGTSATLMMTLHLNEETGARRFCAEIAALVDEGLVFGGHGARGVGLARLEGEPRLRRFDLQDLDGCAAWLDQSWEWRNTGQLAPQGDMLAPAGDTATLHVSVDLVIPPGQDMCIGSGMGNDYPLEPQRVTDVNGASYWRLPGSSLRGLFRAWFSRLAARDARLGKCAPPADSAGRTDPEAGNDEVGWLFDDDEERARKQEDLADGTPLEEVVTCPVAQLFGSLYGAGRIHISDALSDRPSGSPQLQHRRHVAVDRITGGASEGFLFDHAALLPGCRFQVEITIRKPQEQEAQWLVGTLRALDTGLIRVGSSKSSGRLALASPPTVTGPERIVNIVSILQPSEVYHG